MALPRFSGLFARSGILRSQFALNPQLQRQSVRNLNLHEYQSKALMEKYNVRVQRWRLAKTPEEAEEQAKDLAAETTVVKAQVHAGGRGKGHFDNGFQGGVKLCKTPEEVKEISGKMLGHRLTTKQTGPNGVEVKSVMLAESIDFDRELYFAILLDRAAGGPVIVASPMGGMDIEAVAESNPEAIFKVPIDINKGPDDAKLTDLAKELGFSDSDTSKAVEQMKNLYELFIKSDALQVEINPLVQVPNGDVYCVDAKIGFDDNAVFRQKEIFDQRDTAEEDPREVEASKYNLNYIGMEGNIGCMVNGAGLAMSTMDIIKLHGGEPANFLDVGGGATTEQVKQAFKIVSSDKAVKAILVNIFGGIVKCDIIAQGIINAATELELDRPIVVRLAGTNQDQGYQLLKESGLNISTANDLEDAARKAVNSISK
mmetsp:Transcript_12768/g.26958  ORF Transcript_12768/g.26958 Transcript_12768/m.26958 type:complete len:428 (-) Transcript_12768:64-1347(-)